MCRPGFLWVSLLLCTLFGCVSAATVQVTVGSDATLPCTYDVPYNGRQHTCWSRGPVPYSGCGNQIMLADGTRVTERLSRRYQLLGRVDLGDTSLTIQQVQESDSGVYGCRVLIPGWFNDIKKDVTLKVVPGPPRPLTVELRELRDKTVAIRWRPPFDGGRHITSYRIEHKGGQASWDTAVRTEVHNRDQTQMILVDLVPARSYSLRMFSANGVGISEPSNTLTFTTNEGAPAGPPLDVQLKALSPQSLQLTWKPPKEELRSGNLLSYKIMYREAYRTGGRWSSKVQPANLPLSFNLTNLKPSTEYTVLVMAGTKAGFGPASRQALSTFDEPLVTQLPPQFFPSESPGPETSPRTEVTESTTSWKTLVTTLSPNRPDPPILILKEVDESTIYLRWTPGNQGGSSITSYILQYKALNASWDSTMVVLEFAPVETETAIAEANPSTYNIRMFSRNSQGLSETSNVLTVVTTGHLGSDGSAADSSTTTGPKDKEGTNVAAIVAPSVAVLVLVVALVAFVLFKLKHKYGPIDLQGLIRRVHYAPSDTDPIQGL